MFFVIVVLVVLAVAGCVGTLVALHRDGGAGAGEIPRSRLESPDFRPPGRC